MARRKASSESPATQTHQKETWGADVWKDATEVEKSLQLRDEMAERALNILKTHRPVHEITSPAEQTAISLENHAEAAEAASAQESAAEEVSHEQEKVTPIIPVVEFVDETPLSPEDRQPELIIEQEADGVQEFAENLEAVRPAYGDVYKTALRLFPQVNSIRHMRSVTTNPRTHESVSGGVIFDNDPERVVHPDIAMGEKTPVLPIQKRRWVARLQMGDELSQEQIDALPDTFWLTYTFAHELGHAIQNDPAHETIFGAISQEVPDAYTDYIRYVNSDRETNADYIAMLLLSETETGRRVNLPAPAHAPRNWRDWVVEITTP